MFKTKLYDFSSKFIYWAGLINLFWLLFYGVAISAYALGSLYGAGVLAGLIFGALYILILLASFIIWRNLRTRDKVACFIQISTLAISTLVGAWVTLYILIYGVASSELNLLLTNDYFGFLAALIPNVGIGPGVFLVVLDLFSKLIVSISGGNMYLAYHYGPNLLIASLLYLLIVVLYSIRVR